VAFSGKNTGEKNDHHRLKDDIYLILKNNISFFFLGTPVAYRKANERSVT